jgi:hypothetical protein
MNMNPDKLRNMVLYYVSRRPGIGRLHLQKALLVADRVHYLNTGTPLSGYQYVKRQMGPMIEWDGDQIINRMVWSEEVLQVAEQAGPYERTSHYTHLEPVLDAFDAPARDSLKAGLDFVTNRTTTQLSDLTHDQAWESARLGEVIPYDASIQWQESTDETPLSPEAQARLGEQLEDFFGVLQSV